MKKIMKTVAASAVALVASSAFATLPSPTASFENLDTGEKTVEGLVSKDDAGGDTAAYWFAVTNGTGDVETDVIGTVTNYPSTDPDHGDKYFALDTSSANVDILYRTINTAPATSYGAEASDFTGESIGNGIYLDTMVKFTPSDKVFEENDLENGDKLAISYVESDDGTTNIVVRAGYVNGSSITATNYYMNLPSGFVATDWHQLTVRTIANVGYDDAPVGFAIYLDGNPNPLTYDDPAAPGTRTYTDALTGVAGAYLYTENVHALLPSLIDAAGTGCSTLSAVGFKGTGCIDDVAFKSGKPDFVDEDITVTITWTEGVTSFSATDNGSFTTNVVTSGSAGSAEFELDPETGSLTVEAVYASNYTNGTWTVSGTGAAIDGSTFTVVDGATLNIRAMLPKYDVDGTLYGSFAELLADVDFAGTTAESPATIQLLANVAEAMTFDEGYIVLDLNGKSIQGGDVDTYTLVNSGATLTIIDSATGGTVLAPTYEGEDAVGSLYTDAGTNTIYAGTFESTVYTEKFADPENAGDIFINGGVFADPDYESELKFYLEDYLVEGVKATYDAGFVTVGAEPPAPTVISVPTAASNLVYDGTEQTGVAAGEGYTLTGTYAATKAGEYTATATPASGYAWDGGSTEATNITWSIAKAEVTATVSLTVTEATYDSTKTTVTDYTNPSLTFGLGAPELVVNTDYTVGWNATEVSGAGTFTYTVSPVQNSNYTFTEASVTLTITAGSSYPSYIPDDPDTKTAYDTWASTYSVADGDSYEAAFLLNIAPDAADQTLEPTSITIENGKIVIEANKDLDAVNGKVYIKTSATLTGLDAASWSEASLDKDGAIEMTPNATGAFFKIKVGF